MLARHESASPACSGRKGAHLVHKHGPGDAAPPHVALVWQRAVVRHNHHLDLRCAGSTRICAPRACARWSLQATGATPEALRYGHAMLPDVMFPTINSFDPNNAALLAIAQLCMPVVSQRLSWPMWNAKMQRGHPRSSTQCTLCLEPSYAVHMLSRLMQSRVFA